MSLSEFLSNLPLIWFLIGLAFILLELAVPGFILIFFGFGAWLIALLGLFVDIDLALQIILFVIASVTSLVLFRKKLKARFFQSKNDDSSASLDDEFIGKEAIVLVDILPNKTGKVEFKGTQWSAKSKSEIKAGNTAIISDKESICLIVEPLNN